MPNDTRLAPSSVVYGIAERDPRDRGALVPTNMREAMDFATSMATGRLSVPEFLHNNPGDCLRLVMIAGRTGLDPFMLADQTYIVPSSKRMAFQAQAIHAIALASGVLDGDVEVKITGTGDDLVGHATGKRRGSPARTEVYTLRSITVRNSPLWKTQTRQQFTYYCQRAWCRLHAADALMGLVAREDPIDVTATEIAEAPPPASAIDKVAAALSSPPVEAAPAAPAGATAADNPPSDPVTGEILDDAPDPRATWLAKAMTEVATLGAPAVGNWVAANKGHIDALDDSQKATLKAALVARKAAPDPAAAAGAA